MTRPRGLRLHLLLGVIVAALAVGGWLPLSGPEPKRAGAAEPKLAGAAGPKLAGAAEPKLAGAAGPKIDYRGTGVVEAIMPPPSSLHATRPVILIHHDPVPDLMNESMSMPFIAASTDLFRGLHVGDRIAFGMQVTPDALLVVTITRLP